MMKKLLVMVVLMAAGVAVVRAQSAAEKLAADKTVLSLADARSRIDKAIESPEVMDALMKHLSAEDQVKFLADVNKAINDMPASLEERTAKSLTVNHVALTAAQPGNTTALLAEVFATASPDALTVISERFAADLVNRATDPNVTYTDEQFAKLAAGVMEKVNDRTEETDNGSTRSTLAVLMFLRASNETGDALDNLQEQLVDTLKHEDAKELARDEWIPAALGKDGREPSYDSLLASADAGRRPDYDQVLSIAGPQHIDSILADLGGKNVDPTSLTSGVNTPVLDAVDNTLNKTIPGAASTPGAAGEAGDVAGGGTQEADPKTGETNRPTPDMPDPKPYNAQNW